MQMSGGSAIFIVPANTFSLGTATLSASYSGDPTYLPGSGTATISIVPATFSISAGLASPVPPGQLTQSEITISSTTGYTGLVSLSCALTSQPSGATNLPVCSASLVQTVQLWPASDTAAIWLSVTTTAPTAALVRPSLPGSGREWSGIGGTVLALVVLLGIPARRRSWRSMLGILVLLAAFGGLSSCGGSNSGGGGGGGGGGGTTGTTAGTYTFTVTATGNPAITPAPTTTFTVLVN
jgi:hypothetical protein